MDNKHLLGLFTRYIFLILLGLGNLVLIYSIVTPLTVYPAFWIIDALQGGIAKLDGNIIVLPEFNIGIIQACIAGAAYYFLLILNLATPMSYKKRFLSLVIILLGFLILNLLRITILAVMFDLGYQYFDVVHNVTWHLGSTALLLIIWFSHVYLLKIKSIPIYTDIKSLIKETKRK